MDSEKEEIIRARLRKLKEKAPPDLRLMKMNGFTFTAKEMVEEVERGTDIGKKFAEAEEKMLDGTIEKEEEALR